MPFHGTIVTEQQECTSDGLEAISRDLLAPMVLDAATLMARIAQAVEMGTPPSAGALAQARRLLAALRHARRDEALALEDATCGWSGDVEVEVTGGNRTQYDVAWTCPRCGNVTTDVRNDGE